MELTKKEETFCQEVVKQNSYSDAFRIAYNKVNYSYKTVNEKASRLMAKDKIKARVRQIRDKLVDKQIYTLSKSVKRDIKLIEMYEQALEVLNDSKASKDSVVSAERTVKFIGASGYNSAQDRLSKQHGFYEAHNKQKEKGDVNISVKKWIESNND